MKPYHHIMDMFLTEDMRLINGKNFIIKLDFKKKTKLLIFENIIECWKFYIYGRILYYNIVEYNNSLCYDIKLNIRILLDELRWSSM